MVSQPHVCDILSVLLNLVPMPEESLPAGLHPPITIIITAGIMIQVSGKK